MIFVISFASMLVLGLVSRVQAGGCTNASAKGTYGFSCKGTFIDPTLGPLPLAEVGVFTADGEGNISGTLTESFNGAIFPGVTFAQTYTVHSDCTGFAVTTFPDFPEAPPQHSNFVIDDNKKEARSMGTDTGAVVVCIAKKQ
jgi:hypothetical protein